MHTSNNFSEATDRSCEPCGTNLVPYPLSTGPKCGDPSYESLSCNASDGQLSFTTLSGSYEVTSMDTHKRTFFVRLTGVNRCENISAGNYLQLNKSSPFHVMSGCNSNVASFRAELVSKNGVELEVSWDPPREPNCSLLSDCKDWPNSSCNATRDGTKRCLCDKKFRWDSLGLKCSRGKMTSLKICFCNLHEIFSKKKNNSSCLPF